MAKLPITELAEPRKEVFIPLMKVWLVAKVFVVIHLLIRGVIKSMEPLQEQVVLEVAIIREVMALVHQALVHQAS